jgi:hypothetical protein
VAVLITLPYLIDHTQKKRHAMYEVATPDILARSVPSIKRSVEGIDGAWAFGNESISVLHNHNLPRMDGRAGAFHCIWWGEVSDGSDPLEWCRPAPPTRRSSSPPKSPASPSRRTGAPRGVRPPRPGPPHRPGAVAAHHASLRSWAQEHNVQPTLLGARMTYHAETTILVGHSPDCDFAVHFD